MIVLSIISLVISLVVLAFGIHIAVVFQRFNDGIKDWSQSLNDSTYYAINAAARRILSEVDEKVSASVGSTGEDGDSDLTDLND